MQQYTNWKWAADKKDAASAPYETLAGGRLLMAALHRLAGAPPPAPARESTSILGMRTVAIAAFPIPHPPPTRFLG